MKLNEFWKKLNITQDEYDLICKRIKRIPNEFELYLFSAMWSEHCSYKHSKAVLANLPKKRSIYSDENAGGIEIGDHAILFKIESHNHPSAVLPWQGAATGIGGIIRDILAMNARPVALLNSLKFGNLNNKFAKHVFDGVIEGISSYGNCIGVPNIAGEIGFDECYLQNPLVNVMAVGLAEKRKIKISKAVEDKAVLLIGTSTRKDGIHGASFASKEFGEEDEENRLSVQIADPFMKKKLIEATLEIFENFEVFASQDCGAAGLLSSTSEMVYKGKCGMELHLDKVHIGDTSIEPWQIMLSETQERMVLLVNETDIDPISMVLKKHELAYSLIGKTISDTYYRIYNKGELLADLRYDVLGDAPVYELKTKMPDYIKEYSSKALPNNDITIGKIKKVLSNVNFASKKFAYSRYDQTVGDRTSILPGGSGCSALWIYEENKFAGFSIDSRPLEVFLNPYKGSVNTVCEAARNLISCGFEPKGISDCLNFGNPEKKDVAYQFTESVKGLSDACKQLNIPVVSGNVSFYNECTDQKVYPTPVIGMVGICDNYESIISNSFAEEDYVILVGKQISEDSNIGGSLYLKALYDFLGGEIDEVDFKLETKLKNTIFKLNSQKLLSGCVDIGEAGLLGALFEGLVKNKIGFSGDLISINNAEKALFGEINSRYLIATKNLETTVNLLKGVPYKILGQCCGKNICFNGFELELNELIQSYENSLEENYYSN